MIEERDELNEFTRELQWTVVALKEQNDQLHGHIDFVLKGGSAADLEKRMVAASFGEDPSGSPYKTPKIDNLFEAYSDFQPASAAIKSFVSNETKQTDLRRVTQKPSNYNNLRKKTS